MPTVPVDPLVYRFYEIMQVYGLPLKDVIQEMFGDGIMSAIDFTMQVEKEADPQGRSGQDHHVGQVSTLQEMVIASRNGQCVVVFSHAYCLASYQLAFFRYLSNQEIMRLSSLSIPSQPCPAPFLTTSSVSIPAFLSFSTISSDC